MRNLLREGGIAVRITVLIMLLTGIIYPLVVTGVAQGLFHDRANGSLVKVNGQVIGSSLIGQQFTSDKYFHPRPSDTLNAAGTPQPYNAANSGASNLGPTNPALILAVEQNAGALRCSEGLPPGPAPLVTAAPAPSATATPARVASSPAPAATTACAPVTQAQQQLPVDAVTGSGSGLDPDISVAYADLQVARVARARNLSLAAVQKLVNDHILDRQFGVLGERRVNVLDLNLALDGG
jgi:K+-transporting ATPase ATPase C chain